MSQIGPGQKVGGIQRRGMADLALQSTSGVRVELGKLASAWRVRVNAPTAFLKLFDGENFGKLIVRVSPDPTR